MSVKVKVADLTPDKRSQILKDLFLTPKTTEFHKRNFSHVKPQSVTFFRKDDAHLYIPFFYGIYILRAPIIWPSTYHTTKWEMRPNFKYRTDKCDQKETVMTAYQHLTKHRTANLNLFPGAGKTVISACLASTLKIRTLVIFCFTTLYKQWLTTFSTFTTAKAAIFLGNNLPDVAEADVIISMYGAVPKLAELLPTIGCLIIDETHRMCTPDKIEALLSTTPAYVITCSATPERNNGMEAMMHLIAGTEGIMVKSAKPFTIYKVNTNLKFSMERNERGKVDWSKTLNKICYDDRRIALIANLLIQLANSGNRIIAVCERTETLDKLAELLDNYVKSYPQFVGIVNYDTLYGTKKKCEERNILFGTITKIGTAYDEATAYTKFSGKSASILVIMSSFKDQRLLEQVVGRVRDRSKNPVIYDLVDNNSAAKKHWENKYTKVQNEKGRLNWYLSNGGKVVEMEFPKSEEF